ncbi:MAG TPA: UDP-N-acetylmuramoyl-L-alanyl-D-glutamate--2,6-diaminopimelate ligase [Fimbriimonadaceae bacterium]|nr:UDP-N-acetylmuramoyl-L-alanyl-D-glutamate--2,6-diaminopimelate ligase [Fimbriimonadaceae bacterium]
MKLSSLIAEAGLHPVRASGEAEVTRIEADSRMVTRGTLFVCMPSANTDSHSFLQQAKESHAAAAVVHSHDGYQTAKGLGLATVQLERDQPGFNMHVAILARTLLGDPSAKMRVIGVTGTNGKTTTAWMLRDALRTIGRKASYLGTLGFDPDGKRRELPNTTPFPVDMWKLLAEARDKGVEDFVMEASSHALFERRVYGLRFACGVFTNLSQDHLDYHSDMHDYAEAKRLLFTDFAGSDFRSAINVGDPVGAEWAKSFRPTVTFGTNGADLTCEPIELSVTSLRLKMDFRGAKQEVGLNVGGRFNVWNATSALAALLAMGMEFGEATAAMESVTPVPGRFESVPTGRAFSVIVDYAHTDDALVKLLQSVRELDPKRIITVFGCGGDRDKSKRPKMAKAATENSDFTVITSDNPRTEDPAEILNDVMKGVRPGAAHEAVIDRREAVKRAVEIAQDGDVIVIAGKGHENYQIIGRTKYPMDDRELVKFALEATK